MRCSTSNKDSHLVRQMQVLCEEHVNMMDTVLKADLLSFSWVNFHLVGYEYLQLC